MVFPHSWATGLASGLAGVVLILSPLLVWFLEREGWHRATVATDWVSYTWMGYLFLFVCLGSVPLHVHLLCLLRFAN
jgi:hypothetical protein